MKPKIIVASVVAILIVVAISCGLFSSHSKPESFNIQGQWTIDSVENKGSDSSKNMGNLVLALASKDGQAVGIQFNNDSTFQYLNISDSTKGKYYVSADESRLFLKEDSVTHQLNFIQKSDSAVSLASADSTFYYLKRK